MKFEWDENKNRTNKKKHRVSFEQAETVFADETAIIFQDVKHSKEEDRFIVIGKSSLENILFVCFCQRGIDELGKEVIRIISARKATQKERRLFYE